MTAELTRRSDSTAIIPKSFDEAMSLGSVLAQSRYFTDAAQAAQAVVKILCGAELGAGYAGN